MGYRNIIVWVMLLVGCATAENESGSGAKTLTGEERAAMLVQIANSSLLEGNPTLALKNLLEAERLDQSNPELYHSKALAFYQKKDLKKAQESVEHALHLNPKFTAANNTLGKILLDLGKVERSKQYFIEALKDPLYVETYKPKTNLGIAYYRTKELKLAKKQFDQVVEESPDTACVAHYYKGHIAYKTHQLDEAILEYNRATRRFCSHFPEAHYALGIAYYKSKRYQDARRKFVEIQDLFPNSRVATQAMKQLRNLP